MQVGLGRFRPDDRGYARRSVQRRDRAAFVRQSVGGVEPAQVDHDLGAGRGRQRQLLLRRLAAGDEAVGQAAEVDDIVERAFQDGVYRLLNVQRAVVDESPAQVRARFCSPSERWLPRIASASTAGSKPLFVRSALRQRDLQRWLQEDLVNFARCHASVRHA